MCVWGGGGGGSVGIFIYSSDSPGVYMSNLAPLFSHNELCSCTLPSLEQHTGSDSDDSDEDKVRLAENGI